MAACNTCTASAFFPLSKVSKMKRPGRQAAVLEGIRNREYLQKLNELQQKELQVARSQRLLSNPVDTRFQRRSPLIAMKLEPDTKENAGRYGFVPAFLTQEANLQDSTSPRRDAPPTPAPCLAVTRVDSNLTSSSTASTEIVSQDCEPRSTKLDKVVEEMRNKLEMLKGE